MEFIVFTNIVIILALSVIAIVVCRYFRLPPILGYLVIGFAFGPHGVRLMEHSKVIEQFAELGVVFLMFTVGLEFSLNKLLRIKFNVFVLGGLQVLITTALTAIICLLIGLTFTEAFIIGGIVAMSSLPSIKKCTTN